MLIYLVVGQTGEYEDRLEWVSKAFTSKELAAQFMNACNDFVATAPRKAKGLADYDDEEWKRKSPDPAFYCDYTGASYNLFTTELVTDKFMEEILTIKD